MTKKRKIFFVLAGGLSVILAPSVCNGEICEPIISPDLPVERGFVYDNILYGIQNVQISASVSSSFVEVLNS